MKYYDEGWNAYIDGLPFSDSATLDWRDGWLDADQFFNTHNLLPMKI